MNQNNRYYDLNRCSFPVGFPPQHQNEQPGLEYIMKPLPMSECCKSGRKLENKVALITGGDSGIGRAVAYDFVKEGAKVAILGTLDVLINNHAFQFIQRSILDISHEQLEFIFRNNVFSFFYLIQYALPHMKRGSSIINTTSVTAYEGNKDLIDYSSTKGAIVALTRSLSLSLAEKEIRVNAVAPGPIWTPLIPASYSAEEVRTFGTKTSQVPMMRAGQPCEVSPCYVFLASEDASYMTGQVLHPNGGTIVGS